MSESARVTSIDSLKEFRGALALFCDEANRALCTVELEIRRALDWLEHEQVGRWRAEVQRSRRQIEQARLDLNRVRLARVSGETPDCVEQIEALREAERRLQHAAEKLAAIEHWSRVVRRAVEEYHGGARRVADMVEGNPAPGVALLDRMIDSLDAYLAVSPAEPAARPVATPASSGAAAAPANDRASGDRPCT
jgi:chromosome segregation ATPase